MEKYFSAQKKYRFEPKPSIQTNLKKQQKKNFYCLQFHKLKENIKKNFEHTFMPIVASRQISKKMKYSIDRFSSLYIYDHIKGLAFENLVLIFIQ